jgi:hypothetical protein
VIYANSHTDLALRLQGDSLRFERPQLLSGSTDILHDCKESDIRSVDR